MLKMYKVKSEILYTGLGCKTINKVACLILLALVANSAPDHPKVWVFLVAMNREPDHTLHKYTDAEI